MKIAYVCFNPLGGIRRYIDSLQLALLQSKTEVEIHNFIVYSHSVPPQNIRDERLFYTFVKSDDSDEEFDVHRDCVNPQIEEAFEKFLDEVQPDLVDFQSLHEIGASLIGIAKDRGIATTFTVHDYWIICPKFVLLRNDFSLCNGPNKGVNCVKCFSHTGDVEFNERRKYIERYQFIRSMLLEKTDYLIAVSESVKKRLVHEGFPPDKIKVVYPVVQVEVGKSKAKIEREKVHIGFIGYTGAYKGVHVLIEAFKGLDVQKTELFIYGTIDPFFKETLINLKNGSKNIHIKGAYSPSELESIFLNIDVLVVSSVWPETGPLVVQEALRSSVPVIGSNIGGIPGYVQGNYGALFTPGDISELRGILEKIVDNKEIIRKWKQSIPKLSNLEQFAFEMLCVYDLSLKKFRFSWHVNHSHTTILRELDMIPVRKAKIMYNLPAVLQYLEVQQVDSLAIFGSGDMGKKVARYFQIKGIEIKAFIDNDSKKWGNNYHGIPVIAPDEINISGINHILVVSEWENEILHQLKEKNLPITSLGIYSFLDKGI
ncbi:glycosyltransferase [Aneurinibacillus aneurinilyticus]|uniref:glycosyltransferase n=1 Tax=Aneurinibacillus aneurinilyticus TaxID=1391 RepID=UPI002E23BF19|nr:glycosyltransferase [Aneurinibacillus aneurinilyticus]MED0670816.1 glycosyltransferase [Aneurinibacillus aneurinilyticus]